MYTPTKEKQFDDEAKENKNKWKYFLLTTNTTGLKNNGKWCIYVFVEIVYDCTKSQIVITNSKPVLSNKKLIYIFTFNVFNTINCWVS